MSLKLMAAVALWAGLVSFTPQQDAAPPVVTRVDGGTMAVTVDLGFVVHGKSPSLHRVWIAVSDPRYSARLVGTPGVDVVFDGPPSQKTLMYSTQATIEVDEPIVASEVRFICFDVWGEHVATLSAVLIEDLPLDKDQALPVQRVDESGWPAEPKVQAVRLHTSIAYMARYRTKSGKVVNCDPTPALAEAKKLSDKFAREQMDPVAAPGPK